MTRRNIPTYYSLVSKLDVFTALANPTRRKILELLQVEPRTVNSLVDRFKQNRPGISEHLQVLRNARLVRDERRGRERYYHIQPERLVEVFDWLKIFERYWKRRLTALEELLDREHP